MAGPAHQSLSPNAMVLGFAVLMLCQLTGEAFAALVRVMAPGFVFPGPVIGMGVLLLALTFSDHGQAVSAVGTALLGVLSLLFVPSAVGIMQYGDVIFSWGVQLLISVVASTVLTLVVTVYAFLLTERWLTRARQT